MKRYTRGMGATALMSMAEYLDTSYSPDCEYVDGVVVERNVGERPHSIVQVNLAYLVRRDYPNVFVFTEQRVRTIAERRSRVPDVCVTLEDPKADVFESPPFICIEILSRRDELGDVFEKLKEYAAFGVPNIWVIDPRKKKAFLFRGVLEEIEGDALATSNPEIRLPLEEVFRGL